MKPIVKWAGGKSQLLDHIRAMVPNEFNNYYEPFIGGGAVLFELMPKNATINDINGELINLYNQIRNSPMELIKYLELLDNEHENSDNPKEFYYRIRNDFNSDLGSNTPKQGARFIYINKHCFNGLYRVNSKGQFNVPFNNKKKGQSFDKEHIIKISEFLKDVKILQGDFESCVANATNGDFVFFDSPYVPLNPTSFTDYTKEGFDYEDHVRLADLYKQLSQKGVYCMLTNHNTELVNELYKGFNIKVVQVSRMINSDASNRKGEEVIITNYDL